ncbi:MAG: DUF1292 domain-containing protein [Clostridia bacterium]|nr:DUF1292 domain-containing protein [Clostridia bacterium]
MADNFDNEFENSDTIVLYNEANDKDEKFYVLEVMDYKDRQFIILQPAEELEDIAENELLIYELGDEDDEEHFFIPIEDQDLLQEVFDKFMAEVEEYEKAVAEGEKAKGCEGCSGCGAGEEKNCDKETCKKENCKRK